MDVTCVYYKKVLYKRILREWIQLGAHRLKTMEVNDDYRPMFSDDNVFDCLSDHEANTSYHDHKYRVAFDEAWLYIDITHARNRTYVMFNGEEIYKVLLDSQLYESLGISREQALEWRKEAHRAALPKDAKVVDIKDYEGLKAALHALEMEERRSGTPDTVMNYPLDTLVGGC